MTPIPPIDPTPNSEILISQPPISEKSTYNKFKDTRFIRPISSFYMYFMLISSASFVILYFFTNVLRDALLDLFLPNQLSLSNVIELMITFAIANVIWDIILLFALVTILNMVIGRILNLQIWRVLVSTLSSLVISIFIFQLIMFLWFYMGDPIGLQNKNILYYAIELLYYYEINLGTDVTLETLLFTISEPLFDILLAFFYQTTYLEDQSIINYLLLYAIAKGFASEYPFQLGDLGFNPLRYEILFEFIIYALVFTIFFFKFIKPCICVTEDIIDTQIAQYQSDEVFKRKEEGKVLGKSVIVEKKGKSLDEWEVET